MVPTYIIKKVFIFILFWHKNVNPELKVAKRSHLITSSVTYLLEIPRVAAEN